MNAKKIALLFASVVVGLSFLLSGCGSKSQAAESTAIVSQAGAPEQVVESFYRWYLNYPGNFIRDGAHRSDDRLTKDLVQKIDEIIASFQHGGYDPLLCAQDIPGDWEVETQSVNEQEAQIVLHEIWNPDTGFESVRDVMVHLRVVDGQWRIDDVICPQPEPPQPPAAQAVLPEQVVKEFFEWYLHYINEVGNPLVDKAYQTNVYLAPDLVQQVDELVASFEQGGYDPFLCAQDVPGELQVGQALLEGDSASVPVLQIWNPETQHPVQRTLTVQLQPLDGEWRIRDVVCPVAEGGKSLAPEEVVQTFYNWYLEYAAFDRLVTLRSTNSTDVAGWQISAVSSIDAAVDGTDGTRDTEDASDATVEAEQVPAGWQIFRGDEYGYQIAYPADWTFQELDILYPELEAPIVRIVQFLPQEWADEMDPGGGPPDPNAPVIVAPLSLEVSVGTMEEYRRMYYETAVAEPMQINGQSVILERDEAGDFQIIRYLFSHPMDSELRLTLVDNVSGFPARAEGNQKVIDIFQQMLGTFKFTR
jgi:hypothetical protein